MDTIAYAGLAGSKTRRHTSIVGHGLDVDCCLDIDGGFFICLGFFFEFSFVPGVVAQRGVGYAVGIDHYLLRAGSKVVRLRLEEAVCSA